jgi:hypothetical protein
MQEEWKDVVGYEEYFMVSTLGRVFSKRTNKVLKQNLRKDRRVTVATRIGGRSGKVKCFKIHRLVAEAFIPNPDTKSTVNHKDGDPSNNCVSNLEWMTHSENVRHAVDTGLNGTKTGFDHSSTKLTRSQVEDIRLVYKPKHREFGYRALSRKYGVTHTTIKRALSFV